MSFQQQIKNIPELGTGLGYRINYRRDLWDFLQTNPDQKLINWLEIFPENFIRRGGEYMQWFYKFVEAGVPFIAHGVNLSLGTAPENTAQTKNFEHLDLKYLAELKKLFAYIKPHWVSDHLSCSRIGGYFFQDLIPVPFLKESVQIVADNIKFIQDELQLPFLIENPSYYTKLVEPEMTEVEFINQICEAADCGLLLDINNVYVNSVNHNYDPVAFVDEVEASRVVEFHVAGHNHDYHSRLSDQSVKILDTHGEAICKEVYDLLAYTLGKIQAKGILLERDSNIPKDFNVIVDEIKKVNDIYQSASKKELALKA